MWHKNIITYNIDSQKTKYFLKYENKVVLTKELTQQSQSQATQLKLLLQKQLHQHLKKWVITSALRSLRIIVGKNTRRKRSGITEAGEMALD